MLVERGKAYNEDEICVYAKQIFAHLNFRGRLVKAHYLPMLCKIEEKWQYPAVAYVPNLFATFHR